MHRRVTRALATMTLAAAVVAGLADAAVADQRTFVGYGYLPSDAHASAVSAMQAYSSSCQEISTSYSPAGSEHYWKATLTASC